MLLSLLISYILIAVAGHIHFRPLGTSLFVSAFKNSFPAFILGVFLDLAVEAVLAVPVRVVASTGFIIYC